MQSRHSRPRSPGGWQVHPELDRFLAQVDLLIAAADPKPDLLAATWPPAALRRPLFPYGVFDLRAGLRSR